MPTTSQQPQLKGMDRPADNCPGYPSKERMERGPVAIIECSQEIPCNPCEAACPLGAIEIGSPITNLPRLQEDRCKGCGKCLPACPGLAIFLVDKTLAEKEGLATFPYEYLPLPEVGEMVEAVDGQGRVIAQGRVVKVDARPEYNGTILVSLAVAREKADQVRGLKWWEGGEIQCRTKTSSSAAAKK